MRKLLHINRLDKIKFLYFHHFCPLKVKNRKIYFLSYEISFDIVSKVAHSNI